MLRSLSRLTYRPASVLVVDDSSIDDTAALAEDAGYECLRLTDLPEGWTGKSWACWNGARQSTGDWLLFLDADVRLCPRSLELTLAQATEVAADLYSILLQQRCESFWERLLLPYIYCLYFVSAGGRKANTGPGRALANGQYMLIRRSDYFEVGGHQAIRSSVIDDIALATEFLRAGKHVRLDRGEDLGEVRMYDGLKTIREGFAKNALQFATAANRGLATVAISVLCLWLACNFVRVRSVQSTCLIGLGSSVIVRWYTAFGVDASYAVLHPLAAVSFQIIVAEGVARRLLGASTWSGRRLP